MARKKSKPTPKRDILVSDVWAELFQERAELRDKVRELEHKLRLVRDVLDGSVF